MSNLASTVEVPAGVTLPIYMDNHATTPLDPRVVEAMLPYYDTIFGNPSSLHWAGQQAKEAIDAGRQEIVVARKGLVEADKPLLKDIAAMGVTVTQLSAAEREAFVKATRPVYTKWKSVIGADLVNAAEKSIAARKK